MFFYFIFVSLRNFQSKNIINVSVCCQCISFKLGFLFFLSLGFGLVYLLGYKLWLKAEYPLENMSTKIYMYLNSGTPKEVSINVIKENYLFVVSSFNPKRMLFFLVIVYYFFQKKFN